MLKRLLPLLFLALPGLAQDTPAQRGYRFLLEHPVGTPVLRQREFADIWKLWPDAERLPAERANPAQRRALVNAHYGFQELADRPGVPMQLTPDDKGGLCVNCLLCHGGEVDGQVIPGLGNSQLDLAAWNADVARLHFPPALPATPKEPAARGVTNVLGQSGAWLCLRDRQLNRVDKPVFRLTPEQLDLPLDTPAGWLLRRKTRLFCDGFVVKSHRDPMQFALEPDLPGESMRALDGDFRDVLAWFESLRAPAYKGPVEAALAAQGKVIFANECARCHGNYGPGGGYPEKLITLEEVGTDPVRRHDISRDFIAHLGAGWLGNFGKDTTYPEAPGYLAPPLDGVWASAPYLHNGSIPTLWHLLTAEARPKQWLRVEGYDHQKLGVKFEEGAGYSTDRRGLSNQGHRFPAAGLSEADKQALLEYLKTI